jgi:hypothetical protein
MDGPGCFRGHLSYGRQHLFGCDQARSERTSQGFQGGFAWNATAFGYPFSLLVGFIAVEVWSNFDKAKAAVATEASALRAVVLLAKTFPEEQKTRIYALINRHIDEAVTKDWG